MAAYEASIAAFDEKAEEVANTLSKVEIEKDEAVRNQAAKKAKEQE